MNKQGDNLCCRTYTTLAHCHFDSPTAREVEANTVELRYNVGLLLVTVKISTL
jgi:hypothetical protein